MQVFPSGADKMVAGLVTGVGFLGGSVILRQASGEVHGLTTAASVWAGAGVGAVVGTGRYLLGVLLAALILLILVWENLPVISQLGLSNKRLQAGPPPHE
jgi:putative Mg2+ transporter-C (MgtC) family protein